MASSSYSFIKSVVKEREDPQTSTAVFSFAIPSIIQQSVNHECVAFEGI